MLNLQFFEEFISTIWFENVLALTGDQYIKLQQQIKEK